MTKLNTILVGSNSTIAQATLNAMVDSDACGHIVAVSRSDAPKNCTSAHWIKADLFNPLERASAYEKTEQINQCFHQLIIFNGFLHSQTIYPEKRVEDCNAKNLQQYFRVNAIAPLLAAQTFWPLLSHSDHAVVAVLSARVGSISDNQLGGWYGYRASKAALNMYFQTLGVELGRKGKNVRVMVLHPGTVDTPLSNPFQRNIKTDQLQYPTEAAIRILSNVKAGLALDPGKAHFLDWQGHKIAW